MGNAVCARDMKLGTSIQIGDMAWSKFAEDNAGNSYMLSDLRWKDMEFGDDNDWRGSPVRDFLNKEVYDKIINEVAPDALVAIHTDLFSMDGTRNYGECEDKVSLLTYDLYRNNREHIKRWGIPYWLATPNSSIYDYSDDVMYVRPDGRVLMCASLYHSMAARPFFIFKYDTPTKIFSGQLNPC